MKVTFLPPPLLFLGVALVLVQGLPLDNRHSSYQDWNDAIELARNKSGVSGLSVAVWLSGKVVYAEGFGKRNNKGDPVTAETLTPIGSMTKAMTASMIGELVAEGKLDWDKTPVSEYVPEAKFGPVLTSELTLSDYLSHRTGLPHDVFPWFNTSETRPQVFRRLKNLHLSDKLNTDTQYSNIGYVIAGEAAANVAKTPYKQLIQEKIFHPFGLTNSGFSPVEMGKRPNHSRPFYAESLKDAQAGIFHEGDLDPELDFYEAAGDAYSNVFDLVRWGSTIMHFGQLDGKQILNKASVEEVLTARTIYRAKKTTPELSPATAYGMGWFIDSYKGQAMYYHNSDLVITVLSSMYQAKIVETLPYYLADEILNLPRTTDWLGQKTMELTEELYKELADEEAGVDLPPRLRNKPAAHPLSDYEGIYSHPLFAGEVKITLETKEEINDGFKNSELHFLYNSFSSKAEHYHYETFTVTYVLEPTKSKRIFTFVTGQDGQVEGLQLEYLDEFWTLKKQTAKETLTTTITTTTTGDHCDEEEGKKVDIHVEDYQEEEQTVFGQQNQIQFKLKW
ncbi:hypothetical protein BGZ83_001676 [Gryganskiella cystojenkinii]|nr:hypothetical protein BGZ83_001676 [Gryganskiella cystojenkinii]